VKPGKKTLLEELRNRRRRGKKNAVELLLRLSKQIRKDGTFRRRVKRLWSA
jgi:hypothetical protein